MRCSFRAFRDTPLDEIHPDTPSGADQQRIDEGRGFVREWLTRIESCYDAEPLFGQESWKSTLLCAFAGATVVTWSLAWWSRGPRTLTTPPPSTSGAYNAELSMQMSIEQFRRIRDFVLRHGDRMTWCNKYNHNPHYAFDGFDVFLNPEVGQRNINCDPAVSGFDELVIHDRTTMQYFSVRERAGALVVGAGAEPYLDTMLARCR